MTDKIDLGELISTWNNRIEVVEVSGFRFDIEPLQKWFLDTVLPLPPAWQGAYNLKTRTAPRIPINESGKIGFGGWTVLGNTASYDSSWLPNGNLPAWNLNIPQDFSKATVRTEICTGPMAELIDRMQDFGIHISRARITITKPGIGLKYHTDSNYPGELIVRIQVPIISNPGVHFYSDTQRWSLDASGMVYLVNTNHMHKVENFGSDLRFNLIADVDVDQLPKGAIYRPLIGEPIPS